MFKLLKQYPKPRKRGPTGIFTVHDREASFWIDGSEVERIQDPEIKLANSEGILIKGLELIGNNKFRYQEWYLVFVKEK